MDQQQGTFLDSCFYCAFVKPEYRNRNCPKCGGASRFLPAQMMSRELAIESFQTLREKKAPAQQQLEFVHIYGVRCLEGSGVTLEELVREYGG